MGFFSSLFSSGGKAKRLYQKGLDKAHAGDMEGAVEAYDSALRCDPPHELRNSALVNRGMAHAKLGHIEQAQADYQAVLQDTHAPAHIKTAARENLVRLRKRRSQHD